MSAEPREPRARILTPSNVITIVRILLVPVFVAALLAPWPEWFGFGNFNPDIKLVLAALVFIVISGTDWLDGYLARSRNEITDFGKFADPLADKILVCAALISLVELGALPTWVVLIIITREFIVSGIRMLAASKGEVIAASWLGKVKTVLQMIAIIMFTLKDLSIFVESGSNSFGTMWLASWVVMIAALIFTIASLVDYVYKGRVLFRGGSELKGAEAIALDMQIVDAAEALVRSARDKGLRLACAESLTGGLIGAAITSVPGASAVFAGSAVSYLADVKRDLLGVSEETLSTCGVVSSECACEMAEGACHQFGADAAVSVTGIAGPGGAEPGKPVGTVWIGTSTNESTSAKVELFEGTREEVREQTVLQALLSLQELVDSF